MKKRGNQKLIVAVICVLLICAIIPTGIFRLFDHYSMNRQERLDRQPIDVNEMSLSLIEKIQMFQEQMDRRSIDGAIISVENGRQYPWLVSEDEKAMRQKAFEEMKVLFAPWEDQWAQFIGKNVFWKSQTRGLIADFPKKKSFYIWVLEFNFIQQDIKGRIILDEATGKIIGLEIRMPDDLKPIPLESSLEIKMPYNEIFIKEENSDQFNETNYIKQMVGNVAEMYSDYLGESLTKCKERDCYWEMYSDNGPITDIYFEFHSRYYGYKSDGLEKEYWFLGINRDDIDWW